MFEISVCGSCMFHICGCGSCILDINVWPLHVCIIGCDPCVFDISECGVVSSSQVDVTLVCLHKKV